MFDDWISYWDLGSKEPIIFGFIFKVIARCLKEHLFCCEKRRFGQLLCSLRQIFLLICKGVLASEFRKFFSQFMGQPWNFSQPWQSVTPF